VNTRRALIFPVYIPTLIMSFSQGMLIPTLPLFAKEFVTSYGMIGLVLAAEGIGRILGDIPAGLLLRKFGRNLSMILGILIVVTSVALMFTASTTTQIVFLRLLSGIGNATWNVSRHAYLAGATAPHERGRAIAIFGGVNRIGSFAGPAVGGLVAASFGLRIPFVIYAVLAAAACIVAAFSLEKETETTSAQRRFRIIETVRQHWRTLLSAGGGQLCAQAIRAGRSVIIPLYGADIIGLDVREVGLILSISSFVDMSMFYPAGIIMDRKGRKFAMVPCFLIQAIGMAVIPSTSGFWGLLGATAIVGFGNGIGSGTMMTLGADLAPKESAGEFLGLWRLVGDGGHMGSPLIVGAISDIAGMTPAIYVVALLGLTSSAIFAMLVPETLKRSTDTPGPDPAGPPVTSGLLGSSSPPDR
jgi:MFS family permease